MKKIFNWDPQSSIATCILTYKNMTFIGEAKCHPDDLDFSSQYTGSYIAELRAEIKMWQHIRLNDIKSKIDILRCLLANLDHSAKTNIHSYEYKMIKKQKEELQKELQEIDNIIKDLKESLYNYIKLKDDFHSRLRIKGKNK